MEYTEFIVPSLIVTGSVLIGLAISSVRLRRRARSVLRFTEQQIDKHSHHDIP